ncbi:MAG: hypothetical protein CFE21_01455 [Bacteroidetes bacterium B1(2017)]|nr:MAG: hypothetical protein CFE21_01455 [Bacteroidetes bacterium B1(2017)]
MDSWKKVFKSTNRIEAEMVKAMLLDQGVEAVVMNQVDSSLINFITGEASVLCKPEDEQFALECIHSKPIETNE